MAEQHIVFAFAGQGYPPVEAARDLYRTSQVFRDAITEIDETTEDLLQKRLIPDRTYVPITEYLEEETLRPPHATTTDHPSARGKTLNAPSETLVIVSTQYALSKLLQSWNIVPQSVMAYSLGEFVAAAATGSYKMSALFKVLNRRDKFFEDRNLLPQKGGLARVFAPIYTLKQVLAKEGMLGVVDIAGSVSPNVSCLAGDAQSLDLVSERLKSSGLRVQRVKLEVGMVSLLLRLSNAPHDALNMHTEHSLITLQHSNHVQKISDAARSEPWFFPEEDSRDCRVVPGIDHWSSLGFEMKAGSPLNANHYATLLREPLRFMECIQGIFRKHMAERPEQELIFIDMAMGPGQLYKSIQDTLRDTPQWHQGMIRGTATIDPVKTDADAKSKLGWAERQLRANLDRAKVNVRGNPFPNSA